MEKYSGLKQTSKYNLCGLPISIDSYTTCTFGCVYCFANNRTNESKQEKFKICDVNELQRILLKSSTGNYKPDDFLCSLINAGITWHMGGMSDPFQHIEYTYGITRDIIAITREFKISILFSTKTDRLYNCEDLLDPDLHTFQLSVTNTNNRTDFEPNVADIKSRYKLFMDLKNAGFRVGIRIQPFIPGITNLEIIDMFSPADYFTIEGLKIVPTNHASRKLLYELIPGINDNWFTNWGLLNLKPEIRKTLYEPFIEKLKSYNKSFSIADNDMHNISSGKCCCGDCLVTKSTDFNSTALIHKYGEDFTMKELLEAVDNSGLGHCKTRMHFKSKRDNGELQNMKLRDRLTIFYNSPTNAISPKFIFKDNNETLF